MLTDSHLILGLLVATLIGQLVVVILDRRTARKMNALQEELERLALVLQALDAAFRRHERLSLSDLLPKDGKPQKGRPGWTGRPLP